MCDEQHYEADLKRYSRRQIGAIAAAGVGAAFLPQVAGAVEVSGRDVTVPTPDGRCDAYFVAPQAGQHAAVLIWPDIFGLRPAMRQMADRLAQSGYSVLVVNQFYRSQPAPTAADGANTPIAEVRPLAATLSPETNATDAKAFVAWLDAQPQVDRNRKIGTSGYCMGGTMVLRTAAAVPERIGAGASFHGANLASDQPASPHRLIPQMQAAFLIAIAENDDERSPQEKDVLKQAFTDAGLKAEIEVYPAGHGWCPPDHRVHDPEQAERAWKRMLALFDEALA